MSTVSSFFRSFTLAIALREYLAGSTPPRAGVERRGGDDHLKYQKEGGRRLEVIEEEDEGTEEEPGEGSRITHDTPHGDTVLRTNYATNHEDLGLRFTKKHSLRAQRNSSFEIEHSRMLTKSRSNKGLLFKRDALQENGSVKYHSADYSSGDCRNIWHDSHAVIMNIALRAIPSIQVFLISATVLEICTRFVSSPSMSSTRLQSTFLPVLCPSPKQLSNISRLRRTYNSHVLTSSLTLAQAIATVFVVLGSRLRVRCFKEMGKQFTFTHTTLMDHRLVTTGPYGIERHPSYTGVLFAYLSMVALMLMEGSWVRQCAFFPDHASEIGRYWALATFIGSIWISFAMHAIWGVVVTSGLMLRASREDKTLQERFGDEWEQYRKIVPSRFVPYVL